jgi:hypothetical protein
MQRIDKINRKELMANKELEKLRLQLWKARGRQSRRLGGIMLLFSAILLILAYFTRYLTFEVSSLLALLIGSILMIYNLDPQVKIRTSSQAILSGIQIFIYLKRSYNASGKGEYALSKTNEVKLFIPKESEDYENDIDKNPEAIIKDNNHGLLIDSPGQQLFRLYEEELGHISGMNLSYLIEWLPRVMVDSLNICEKIEMFIVNNEVHSILSGSFIRSICQRNDIKKDICYSSGCPLTASIADTLAISQKTQIRHIECRYDQLSQKSYVVQKLNNKITY